MTTNEIIKELAEKVMEEGAKSIFIVISRGETAEITARGDVREILLSIGNALLEEVDKELLSQFLFGLALKAGLLIPVGGKDERTLH